MWVHFTDLSGAVCVLAEEYFPARSGRFICGASCDRCIHMALFREAGTLLGPAACWFCRIIASTITILQPELGVSLTPLNFDFLMYTENVLKGFLPVVLFFFCGKWLSWEQS